ncbi:putative MFS transporter [Aneurinibacillus soli]|uniref:Inner membrane metabolite transport protein YgcS n=1 Tax=Aneurinibacillus soli TaxID=1500254 RepID=A0A0U4WAW4_9BACL|nr:MFS transporter [Aneurinibacillus soli]PYE58957.1 putative MFS transporter [Aneurinibacillus soli]BAU26027.1 Inner membrane metabolite transport protein YgcS [Aneurinibacillus soli]
MNTHHTQSFLMDDAPLNKFHLRITALTFGSNFSDGYALGIIGMALTLLGTQMNLGPMWNGLLGSSALIGLFIGSLVLGWLSDRIGRQKIFLANFLIIGVASLLQFWVNDPLTLFILRILIGIGLGGDYAVGSTLLAEFSPKKYRGFLLASLCVIWTVGYVISNVVGFYLEKMGPESWRWMLASAAIPAFIVLVLRIGTPESPRWLISMGRKEEAMQIVKKYVSPHAVIEDVTPLDKLPGFRDLFSKRLWRRTTFGSLFYVCNVIPYFAIYTFLPIILSSMGYEESFLIDLLLNGFLLLGGIAGLWLMEKFSRRGFTIYTFAILAITLLPLGIIDNTHKVFLIICFAIFTFVMSAASNLTLVYPAELFPTEIRASGVGLVTAVSRVGSAIGTFLLPVVLNGYGVGVSMIAMTIVLVVGAIVSILWAPETKSLDLDEASNLLYDEGQPL